MGKLKTVNIKGKEYVEVNERLIYFRKTYPNFSLTSEVLEKTNESILILASIINEDGRVIATGMAEEVKGSTFINKTPYVENCETSAWGRALGNFGMPQATASVSGGPGAAFTDPNNTTTTGNFSINPNAGGRFANAVEATGAPGEPTQFADGSEGYMVNRFGGFRGPTGGGTIPANVATANNFSTDTAKAASQIFGNSTQFQPRKRLITL